MRDPTGGWEAHVSYDPNLFGADQVRLMLRRPVGPESAETIRSVDGRTAVLFRYDPTTAVVPDDDPYGLVLPRGVCEAIAQAVDPGPSAAELAAVREALTVERIRVDAMLTSRASRNSGGGVLGGINVHTESPGPGGRR